MQKQSKSWSGAGTTGRWLRVQHLAWAVAAGLGEMLDIFSMGTMDHGLACFLEQPERFFFRPYQGQVVWLADELRFLSLPFLLSLCPCYNSFGSFKAALFVLHPVNSFR